MARITSYTVIIPIYGNSKTIPYLLIALNKIYKDFPNHLEVIFVVDGNIENEYLILKEKLKDVKYKAQLICHSRNFGSFAAIRTGLELGSGNYFVYMSADLQESPRLITKMFQKLAAVNGCDVVVGNRLNRHDGTFNTICSNMYWKVYKWLIQKEMPQNGVDIFGCNKSVRNILIDLKENNTSLIGLLFWIGFKRETINYSRKPRLQGKSMWSYSKKIRYMVDSILGFSDLPINLLIILGLSGIVISIIFSIIVLLSRLMGTITVQGYATTLLTIIFFGSLNLFSFGIIGLYIWRTFENTKNRPNAIIMTISKFNYLNE